MRRKLKKLVCAILCTCLLVINTPGSMSYAENAEQYATDTDATYVDSDVTETTQAATATDAENNDTLSATTVDDAVDNDASSVTAEDVLFYAAAMVGDAVLYAASADESGGGVPENGDKYYINDQQDWNALFNNTHPFWIGLGSIAKHAFDTTPVVIILNSNAKITLSDDTTLWFDQGGLENGKECLIYGEAGNSINLNGHTLTLQTNYITIQNVNFENGTVNVSTTDSISITNCNFENGTVNVSTTDSTSITNCNFESCPEPCVSSSSEVPVSFSNCTMNNCGLLFETEKTCEVSFSDITATNCTGTVFGQTTAPKGRPYIIKSISGCKLSTSETGLTAIDQSSAVGNITNCEIEGFDTGIKLNTMTSAITGYDTLTLDTITIKNCITGVSSGNLHGYENTIISGLIMEAREGASGTVGYIGNGNLTTNSYSNYNFDTMPQITNCTITGFDTGINLESCYAKISDCDISACKTGISIWQNIVVIVNTQLSARALEEDSIGVTTYRAADNSTNGTCYLIDCDIKDFVTGSYMRDTTIISCTYQNRDTNLICDSNACVYDTKFSGGKNSVIMKYGSLYCYGCIVEGDDTTQSGFSMDGSSITGLYIYSLNRPYHSRTDGYDKLKEYSKKTVNSDAEKRSEISNCNIGVDFAKNLYIGDTHIHDCGTGIKSSNATYYSYNNNLIERCECGMDVYNLQKTKDYSSMEEQKDIIRDCTVGICNNNNLTSYDTGWDYRLEIYNCEEYGIMNKGYMSNITVDIHDCGTGIYITEDNNNTIEPNKESKIYNNSKWNIDNQSDSAHLQFRGSEITLTDGAIYLASTNGTCKFQVDNLYGTVVFDTAEAGYYDGRKVAELAANTGSANPDIASQMFAEKEGFVISTTTEDSKTYAVFAAGCDVTYDVTTNGGDTFDGEKLSNDEIKDGKRKRISYPDGSAIDLTYTASKTDYEFIGWNTDKDAKVGLDTLTAGTKDITLYAIYKKTVDINYHTYSAASDYEDIVTFYNNEEEIEHGLATYNAGGDNTFAGYVLDEDADVSSADDLMKAGDNVTVSLDGLDVYCVYEKQGQIKYLKKDGTTLSTESKTIYQISTDDKEFEYTVRAGEPVTGFTFKGWKDADDNRYAAGATISTMESSIVLTPIYEESSTEDCNVTYNVTANGGGSFSGGSLTQISYSNGDPVDLTYTASKTGYEFVGWNTNQNAKEGLATLTAETEDITLYAIYKKTAYINYHTYNAASDYRTAVTFYNNEEEIERGLATYNAGGDNTFVGYVLNENAAVSSADALKKAGDNVTVSPSGLNVYCVYEKQGQIKYLKKDGTTLSTESKTVYQISTHTKKFEYTVRAGQSVTGFTFKGWKDAAGTSYAAGATISTTNGSLVLTPVYVVKEKPTTEAPTTEEPTTEKPTTEAPTTETPTTEEPTTEASTAEDPIIQPPTTEAPTTETPAAGPVTGDSTNPIGVIGLGMLSLLGILVLMLKNKRKN